MIPADNYIHQLRNIIRRSLFIVLLIIGLSCCSWHKEWQQYLYKNTSTNIFVSSLIYLENQVYTFQPAYYGAPLLLAQDTDYYVRMQYFTNHPSLCSSNTNIVVVDSNNRTNSSSSSSSSNDVSEFVIPAPPNAFEYNSNSIVIDDNIPVALLVLLNDECDPIQQVLNAQTLHPSIGVLFISSYVPNSTQPLELYLRDDTIDVRLFVSTISNDTGTIIRQFIIEAPDNITALGGPILHFDSIGTFYNTDSFGPQQPPANNNNSTASRGIVIFVVVMHILVFTACIIGSSRNRITSFASIDTPTNVSSTSTTNNDGAVRPPPPVSQRRLLNKEEVQQFITTLSSSNTPSTTKDIEVDPDIVPVLHVATSTVDDNNNDSEYYCSICLTELSCCQINNITNSIDNDLTTGVIARLPCLHVFHMKCIIPWLTERQSHCPLCKYDVLDYVTQHLNASVTDETLNT
jgi:hypothetical protein